MSYEELVQRLSERMGKFNDPKAMVLLGLFYTEGLHSLPVDQSEGFELFQRASNLGYAEGTYNLGFLYRKGEGTKLDMKKALHHYQI